jgi:hypothetical protein
MVFSEMWFRRILVVLALALVARCTAQQASVVMAPRGGIFARDMTVTLSSAAKEIRYTFDGTEPGTNSPLYTAPLNITNSTLLKARAFSPGTNAGALATDAYTLIDTNVAGFSSTLPLVIINTFGHAMPSTNAAWMQVINVGTNQRAIVTGAPEFAGPAKLKPRGYTSLRYPKKSYSVETVDANGEETAVPLLGMPADSDWVLYAPYPDKTLVRDVLAYELSNKLGHYAARTRFVEVFINDTTNKLSRAQYAGIYVLEEKTKAATHRVALHKLSANDNTEPNVTGGYLFKKDHLEKAGEETSEAPPRTRPLPLRGPLPTGPGGFPAAAAGFLPPSPEPAFSNALSVVTNTVAVTNALAGTNVVVPAPSVTVVKTNTLVVTNMVSVTNSVVATNLVVATNWPVATNVAVTSKTVISTNPVVATHAVAGTNTVATTNNVDANTTVITTTTAITTSATYRTNMVIATNTVAVTNLLVVTNVVVITNSVVVTNSSIASVPAFATNRVLVTNIFTLGPPELSPYAVRLMTTGEGFVTSHSNAFFFVEPKPTKITSAQRGWLTNHLNRFEQALYGPDFRNPTNGYAAFIDVDSFIDQHLFVEATKNIDGFRFSTYFTKDRGGKLKMGPIWDWNLSFGNARGKQGYMAEHWYWPQLNDQQYSWFRRLFEDPDFGQRYVDRWAQWRTNTFSTSNVLARVDEMAAVLKGPAARNFERWPILGEIVDPEYFAGKTYDEDIQYLKTWITNRFAWMDAQLVPAPVISRAVVAPQTNAISFNSPTGQVYFTVDGSDPRLPGGNVSPAAQVYQSPVAVTNRVALRARTRNQNRWSSPVIIQAAAQEAH